MNYSIILYIVGKVMMLEATCFLIPAVTSIIYGEHEGLAYLTVGVVAAVIGYLISSKKKFEHVFFAREGFVMVALSWIVLSVVGAIPFVVTGEIPNMIDALFETVSGFTTTGASILEDVESLSHTSLIWRSFTHWVGGMGVIVLLLAILPMAGGYNMHLMKAESPGPVVGKLVPRLRDTAKILYLIYLVMTVIEFVILVIIKMPVFDALCITFGTAGTGGFGIKADSLGSYSYAIQVVVTVFMILFGVNFNAYFLLLGKHKKDAFKIEEVRWYFGIIFAAIIIITINIRGYFENILIALNHAAFQVGSIITTTGYSTTDFDLWPQLSRNILIFLMMCGACAGSTGGGLKVSRIVVMVKSAFQEIGYYIHPRGVKTIKMDGKVLEKPVLNSIRVFLITYVMIYTISMFLLSLNNFDFETNFTAIAATFNNIGPGLAKVGPMANFNIYSYFSKLVLTFDMLAGRLELYPMLLLFCPGIWKIGKSK
ncbi:TrkH family potassium uptake protein [Lachnoanaerobaculum saburreum]|uniref:Cation transport protein n=1 Tax=Lachnoanaerobaculum saburreum TaxID=467210 RepID=A0A133ZQV1_9FIRM|nr:TrkH family potassium uptake protein [Lachnoanaerobaculum saburreum]KXB57800.1 cation transport protein [Lachnoanaerobaculum saburreum]